MEMPRLPRMPAAVVYGVGCSSQLLLWLCATVNKAWSFDGIYNGGLLLPTKKCDPCNPLINFWTVWHHVMCEFRLKGVFFYVSDNPPRSKFEDGIDAKNSASGLYKVVPNKVSSSPTTLLLHSVLFQYLSVASHFARVSHWPLSLCVNISLTTLTLPQYLTSHSHFA